MEAQVYRLTGPRILVLETEPLPEPGKGQIQAQTLYSAISPGTEVSAYKDEPPLRPMKVYPRLLGYCNVAQVTKVDGGVEEEYQAGDLVYTHQSHRTAFVCDQSKVLCKLPKEVDPAEASATYLFHLGYNALLKGRFKPGANLAVVGLGVLGLGTVAVGRMSGGRVMAISNQASSQQTATVMGADRAMAKDHDRAVDEASELTRGVGIDLVVNTSNSWEDYELSLKLVRTGGTICLMGFPGRTDPIPPFNPLASQYLYDKQLTITYCGYTPDSDASPQDIRFTLKRNVAFLMDQVAEGRLQASKLITKVIPWRELDQTYQDLAARKPGLVTAVIDWSN